MKLHLLFVTLALLFIPLLAQAQVVSPAPSPLAVVEDDSAWQVIPQHPLDPTTPPSADDPRWLSLGVYRSRDYQLANPREPGLGLWLQTTVEAPRALPTGSTLVLAMANALIADGAFLNGTAMANETFTSNRPFPHDRQVPFPGNTAKDAPFFGQWDDLKTDFWAMEGVLGRDFGSIRKPLSAIFSVPAAAHKAGRNTLQLAVYEQSVNTMFPGPVVLRQAQLADRIQLNSFTRSAGDNDTQTVLLVQQSLPGPEPVQLILEMQDEVGAVRWSEPLSVDFTKGKLQQAVPITPKSLQDYKAVVRARIAGQPELEHWATLHQARRQPAPFRDSVAISTTNWEHRRIAQDEAGTYPPPADNWRSGKPGSGAPEFKHRTYYRATFTVPADLKPGNHQLEVGELRMKGDFYLNGTNLGTRRYYECPFVLDLSGALKLGQKNELVVVVYDATTPEFVSPGFPPTPDGTKNAPAFASRFHYDNHDKVKLNFLTVLSRPATGIEHTRIVTSVEQRTLSVTTTLVNPGTAAVTLTPSYTVQGKTGQVFNFSGAATKVPAGGSVAVTTVKAWKDAKLWSPDAPNLYALETTVSANGKAVDATRERFGFREITIAGKNFLLNGEIIRFRTLAPSIRIHQFYWPDAYGLNTGIDSLRNAKEVGFNAFRIRDANYLRAFYDACDEIGLACGILSDVVDNHNTKLAFTDPVTWDNSFKELSAFYRDLGNRPAVLWYDLGNENISYNGPSSDPKVADFIYRNEQRVRAMDPTRFVFSSGVEGGYDGRAQVYSPHYPGFNSQFGAFNPTQAWFWPMRHKDIPESLRERALWPESDPTNRYKGMMKFPGSGWAEVPFFNDEYAWMQGWSFAKVTGDGQPWAGERAMKPWSPHYPNGHRTLAYPGRWRVVPIGQHLGFLERIERETQAYRGLGIAGLQRWDLEYRLPEGPHMPVVAFLRETDDEFFADQPLTRTLYAVNDAESATALDLEVRVFRFATDGKRMPVFAYPMQQTLNRGQIVNQSFTVPTQNVSAPTAFAVEVVRRDGANERILQRQQWTISPRSFTGDIPAQASAALYDPSGTSAGLFEALGVTPTQLTSLEALDKSPTKLLVIGEDAPVDVMRAAAPQLAAFMQSGGTLFVLRQPKEKGIQGWLPQDFAEASPHWSTVGHRFGGSQTSLLARNHPLFAGLMPEDFGYWAPYGLVFGCTYNLNKPLLNARILVGLPPFSAQLIEGTYGKGRYLVTTLEITPETMRVAPAPARLLANLVRWSASGEPVAPPVAAVVLGKADAAVTKALKDGLKIKAEFRTDEPALKSGVLILAGDAVPSAAYADQVGSFLRSGGTVLVQQGSAALAPWLSKATSLAVTTEPAFANDVGTKLVVHPLLAGIGEGDLQWDNTKFDPKVPGTYADLLFKVPGAVALTAPEALTVTTVGQGRLIIDQSRWFAAKESARGMRYQRTLLANLGLTVAAPDYGKPGSGFTLPKGLDAFTTIPLGTGNLAANRTGIDLSKVSDSTNIAGVPFRLFGAQRTVIALPSAADLPQDVRAGYGKLPAESAPIAVGRKTKHLFFAHTGFYHQAPDGDVVLTYDVRYVGHEKIIGGQDAGDTVVSVPVRAGAHLSDWFVAKGSKPPANGAVFPTGVANDALITIQRWDNPFPDRVIDSIVVRSVPTAKSQTFVLGVTAASPE